MRSPFFEINSDPFYYPSDNNEDRGNKLDSESKVQERAAEDVSVESRSVQAFYCDLCECKSRKIETVRNHMKKKQERAVFVCGHCLTSTHRSGAAQSAPERWVNLRLWRSECRTHTPVGGSPTAHGRWEPLLCGQGGISLEYQTYTSAYLFDTLVSGLAQGREQALPPPTAWTPTKILSPNIRYFVAILRFVGI